MIRLKQRTMQVRENGEFQNVDMLVGDTAENIDAINAAGAEAVARVQEELDKPWALKGIMDGSKKTLNVDLSGCTELCLIFDVVATGSINLYIAFKDGSGVTGNGSFINGIGTTGKERHGYAEYANYMRGIYPRIARYNEDNGMLYQTALNSLSYRNGKYISDIASFSLSSINNHTSLNIEIYAR